MVRHVRNIGCREASSPDDVLHPCLRAVLVGVDPLCTWGLPNPVASFGPFLAALVVLALTEGKAGVLGLFRRMIRWRVAPGWYAVALLLPAVLAASATALNVLLGAQPPVGDPTRRLDSSLLSQSSFSSLESAGYGRSPAGGYAYLFLTDARAVPSGIAAASVSGYWIALLLGRVVLGPVASRSGPRPVLVACMAGMGVGATLLLLPGFAPVAGILLLGLCAAPMFPLMTLTTPERVGAAWTDRAVGLQSAASAAGSATLPALIGLLIGPYGSQVIAPSLLILVLLNTAAFAWTTFGSQHKL